MGCLQEVERAGRMAEPRGCPPAATRVAAFHQCVPSADRRALQPQHRLNGSPCCPALCESYEWDIARKWRPDLPFVEYPS